MFGNFSMWEILLLLLVVLLLFGAKRIPEIAGSMGKGITEFKRSMSDAQRAITEPVRDDVRSVPASDPTPAVSRAPLTVEEEATREPKRLLG